MLGHERLDEERALFRVEAGADPVRDIVEVLATISLVSA